MTAGPLRAHRRGHRARLDLRPARHRHPVRGPRRRRRRASSCSPARSCASSCCPRASPAPGAGCCRARERSGEPARAGARRPRAPWATRRPWLALAGAGAVTVALAAPAAGLELGQPDDRNLTPGHDAAPGLRPARRRLRRRASTGRSSSPSRCRPAARRPRSSASTRELARRSRAVVDVSRADAQPGARHGGDHRHAARRPAGRRDARARGPAARSRRSRPRWATPARPPTSAAGPRATATRRRRSRRASRCSPPPSSGSRCCSCSPRSAPGGSRCSRPSSTSPRSPPPTASSRSASRPRPARSLLGVEQQPVDPVRAAVHVRDPVRPLDRLQRVPALARARGVGPPRATTAPRSRPPRPARGRSSPPRARS